MVTEIHARREVKYVSGDIIRLENKCVHRTLVPPPSALSKIVP